MLVPIYKRRDNFVLTNIRYISSDEDKIKFDACTEDTEYCYINKEHTRTSVEGKVDMPVYLWWYESVGCYIKWQDLDKLLKMVDKDTALRNNSIEEILKGL